MTQGHTTHQRTITMLVVHCTAGHSRETVESIMAGFRRHGWRTPGYHYVIDAAGTAHRLLDERRIANGVKGHNRHAIHIAYTGGIDSRGHATDNRTPAQRSAMTRLLARLKAQYPRAIILGHRDLSPDLDGDGRITPGEWIKECPCFDAAREYATL